MIYEIKIKIKQTAGEMKKNKGDELKIK